jgi:dTDP-4-dehydrorhamnose reductase
MIKNMNKLRLLITGGSGLLALNWACAVRDEWDVILGMHHHTIKLRGTSQYSLDLDDLTKLEIQLDEISPDLIVHTAGLTGVDLCEKNPTLAKHVNAEIAKNVAVISARKNINLIHISTDHLFADTGSLYLEDSVPRLVNEYAKSKFLAEKWVQEVNPQALILRTNFFCWGMESRQSISDWIINSLEANKTLQMFDDVFITPILADTLALLAHELVANGVSGIFNLVGDEKVSKYEFAIRLATHFKLPIFNINRHKVVNANLFARRPLNMSLDNSKATLELKRNIGGLDIFFNLLGQQEIEGRRKELYNSVFT